MFGLLISTIYSLVVVIAVPLCVVAGIRRKKRENNDRNRNDTFVHSGYVPGNTQRNVTGNTSGSVQRNMQGNGQKSMPGNGQNGMQGNASGKAAGNTQRTMAGNTPGEKTRSGSTTEYLERKAMEDQREHVAEKMEEQRRVNAKYGNMPIARRHILGEPVPSGMRLACCKYCGAENEVKTGYRSGLACYFCRTEL